MARPKGSESMITADMREKVRQIVARNMEDINKWLKDIENPKDRLQMMVALMEYTLPKLARVETTGEDGGPILISWYEANNNTLRTKSSSKRVPQKDKEMERDSNP